MDAITASLLQEAGQKAPAARPDWAATSAQGRAEQPARDATARAVVAAESGTDPAASAPIGQEAWSARLRGEAAANDPITEGLQKEAGGSSAEVKSQFFDVPGATGATTVQPQAQPEQGFFEKYVKGPTEVGLAVASSIPATLVGNVAGIRQAAEDAMRKATGRSSTYGTPQGAISAAAHAQEVAQSLTYAPRSEAGQEQLQGFGEAFQASKLAGLGPQEGVALSALATGPRMARVPKVAPSGAGAPAGALGSVGAAGAEVASQARAMASKASPELQATVEKVADKMNPQALRTLERHVDADTLPVPVRLMPGQATQDPVLITNERNIRATPRGQKIMDRINEQNQQMGENVDAIRERAAPDVYVNSRPEIGDLLIQAYKDKDAALNAAVSAKYKALRDANGGQFPLDGVAFVDAADAALHKGLLYEHTPAAVRRTMDRLREGQSMTFEQFEAMRTNLARVQRSATDGNERAAAGVIRQALEDMPLPQDAAQLKPIADAARAAARERFALIEADPAYKAVVRNKAKADNFIQKFIVGAETKAVETMKANLADNPTAQQAMAAGALERLKSSAMPSGEGAKFSQNGYNKALESLRPKLGIVFTPQDRATVEQLGRVARYVQDYPAGHAVNVSNTATVLMGEAAKAGGEAVAGVLAAKGVPIGLMRRMGSKISESRAVGRTLEPYGGLRIKDMK